MRRPLGQGRLKASFLVAGLLLASVLGAASALESHRHLKRKQADIMALYHETAAAQQLMLLIADGQALHRQYLISGHAEDRDASLGAADALRRQGRDLAGRLEPALVRLGLPPLGAQLEHVLRVREQKDALAEREGLAAARASAAQGTSLATSRQMRAVLAELHAGLDTELERMDGDLREGQVIGLLLIGGSSVLMLTMLLGAVAVLAQRRRAAEHAREELDRRGRQVATLFRMGELLQSTQSPDDVHRVVMHTAQDLLPELEGAFYAFNPARDRLDLLSAWGMCGVPPVVPEHLLPNDCWALKRGRPHGAARGGLRCDHAGPDGRGCHCVPMQARGETHGVLMFFPEGDAPLGSAQAELAAALADGVSLALANLGLREKLRNQALRDDLTGLHNRRFLEETLPRLVAHAERRRAPIAVLMLDLDHFKQVNDRHGHAVGDAVLREVGTLLSTRLRRMDVACRYGGEELIVLMPDCSAADALARAREICALVRGLGARAGESLPPVTVSIGVAAWPEHGTQIGRVLEAADAALYAAKRQGRDRAVPAEAAMPVLAAPG